MNMRLFEFTKVDKKEVNYSTGMKKSHCGICEHYHDNKCELVKGFIESSYWCEKFEKETTDK